MRVFKTEIRVNYSDTDAMKIVYHSNYIKFFEIGRCEMLREIGYPYLSLEARGLMLPIISCSCEYKSPAVYDDLLEIHTRILEFGGAKVRIYYEIYRKETGQLLVTGETKSATVGLNMKPVILKKKMPDLYEKLLSLDRE